MKRTVFLTPGIVELGSQSEQIHIQIAKKLIEKKIDLIILIQTKGTRFMQQYFDKYSNNKMKNDFLPEILTFESARIAHIELKKILQLDDIILFQNDLTDNYS